MNIQPLTALIEIPSGGILLYVTEDIPSKMLKADPQNTFEGFFMEINFKGKNGFLVAPVTPILPT